MSLAKTVHLGNIPHVTSLMLKADTLEHLDWLAKQLSRQRQTDVSRSEAVEYLTKRNWVKTMKRSARARSEADMPKRKILRG